MKFSKIVDFNRLNSVESQILHYAPVKRSQRKARPACQYLHNIHNDLTLSSGVSLANSDRGQCDSVIPPVNMCDLKEWVADTLEKQLVRIRKERDRRYDVVDHHNIFRWTVVLQGPSGSGYEGHRLVSYLIFTPEYPKIGPRVYMGYNIFHPNIDPFTKRFYVERLMSGWRPHYDAHMALGFVLDALANPSKHNIVNKEADKRYHDKEKCRTVISMMMDVYRSRLSKKLGTEFMPSDILF